MLIKKESYLNIPRNKMADSRMESTQVRTEKVYVYLTTFVA